MFCLNDWEPLDDVIEVGKGPNGMAVSGNYLYVANQFSDTLSIVNILTREVFPEIKVGRDPCDVAVSGDVANARIVPRGASIRAMPPIEERKLRPNGLFLHASRITMLTRASAFSIFRRTRSAAIAVNSTSSSEAAARSIGMR